MASVGRGYAFLNCPVKLSNCMHWYYKDLWSSKPHPALIQNAFLEIFITKILVINISSGTHLNVKRPIGTLFGHISVNMGGLDGQSRQAWAEIWGRGQLSIIIQKILFKLLKTVAKTFSEEVQEETYRAIQASGMSLLRLGAQKASLKYVWKYEDY